MVRVPNAANTRGGTSLGPGPIRMRSGIGIMMRHTVNRLPLPCYTLDMLRLGSFAAPLLASLVGLAAVPPTTQSAPDGMGFIPPGTFWMACEEPGAPDAQRIHQVSLAGFFID